MSFLSKSRRVERLQRVPPEGEGTASEATEDEVLLRAAERYRSKGLPPVIVYVLWHRTLDRRRIPELAADLADLVQENLPEPNQSVTVLDRRRLAGRPSPQEVASLTVLRRESITKNSWTPVRAAFVPTIATPDVQEILRNKEAKVPSYRQHCREAWLLIVARGFEPSTFGDLGPEVESHRFESGFERVFFLNYFDGILTELHVRPAP